MHVRKMTVIFAPEPDASENLALGRILGRAKVGAKQLGNLGFDCSVRLYFTLVATHNSEGRKVCEKC